MQTAGTIIFDGELTPGSVIEARGAVFDELLRWNPRVAEAITIADRSPKLFRARVLEIKNDLAKMLVFEDMGPLKKLPRITLLQALPEKERIELIIEKAAELGASAIVPFKSERSISLEERDARQKKSHKWQEIALKAAKQSRGPFIPRISVFMPFEEALRHGASSELKLILWEKGGAPAKEVLRGHGNAASAAVAVGPEGGFTDREVDLARMLGYTPVSLGQRILRTETAAIYSVALLSYELTAL